MSTRLERVAAARGERPLDLLIEDVRVLNVYTQEIYPADIGISGGTIVFAGPGCWDGPPPAETFAGQGRIATPGLIDTHLHIESSMIGPESFAAAVLPHGTTTVMIDPHEIANVVGLRGVAYMLEASADLPLRVLVQAPSCVPAVPALETAGADFGAAEIATMLGWDRVIGLAEVLGQVALLVAGLLSESSVPEVAGEFAPYVAAANAVRVVENPIRLVTSLPLPVVPNFRPTDLGLVDVSRQIFVPAFEFSR